MRKILCAAALFLATSFASADMIGVNYSVTEKKDETSLKPEDKAGAGQYAQTNWNDAAGADGTLKDLKDDKGVATTLRIRWRVEEGQEWRSQLAATWGFEGLQLKLMHGHMQLGHSLKIDNIPYEKYDIVVYTNAGDNGGKGSVTATATGDGTVDAPKEYSVDWQGGSFVEGHNYVVLKGNTAKNISIEFKGNVDGGWNGVAGWQIVKAE